MRTLSLILLVCLFSTNVHPATQRIRVAVASNFHPTLDILKRAFLKTHPNATIDLIPGSTGKLYAQIEAGAPYHIFFAADARRPLLLEANQAIQPNARFIYAYGILALWSKREELKTNDGTNLLQNAAFDKLAIANPKLAPYGKASIELLDTLGALETNKDKLVYGENVSQALHFAKAGAADFALISYALIANNQESGGTYWLPALSAYRPIEQQAVLLTPNTLATRFFDFCKSKQARAIIKESGYRIP